MIERYPGDPNIDWDEDLFLDAKEVGDYTGGFEEASCADLFDSVEAEALDRLDLDNEEMTEVKSQAESKAEIDRVYSLNAIERTSEGVKDSYRGLNKVTNPYNRAIKKLPPWTLSTVSREVETVRNLGLVADIAARWRAHESLKREDFFQAGFFGLMQALESYNQEKGKLVTHIGIGIRGSIGVEIDVNERTLRMPHSNLASRVRKIDGYVHRTLRHSEQMPLEAAELYAAVSKPGTNFTAEEAEEYLGIPEARLGLDEIDEPIEEDKGYDEVEDLIFFEQIMAKTLKTMKPRRQEIFFLASGIWLGLYNMTELGRHYGTSHQAVSQQYEKARKMIEDLLPLHGIKKPNQA